MEADARVAKFGQKARHPPLKRPRRRAVAAPVRVRSLGLVPIPAAARTHPRPPVSASLDTISKADAAMSRWVIAAGLKLIVVPVDSTWMRRSLASGSRARASHASRARAGRSRQRQSKWAGSTRRCTRTALVTAPFLILQRAPMCAIVRPQAAINPISSGFPPDPVGAIIGHANAQPAAGSRWEFFKFFRSNLMHGPESERSRAANVRSCRRDCRRTDRRGLLRVGRLSPSSRQRT